MTLRHLKIFVCLYENDGNTTRTADALYIAQPVVSCALKEMEQHYGQCFFERRSKRLYVTEAGKKFYKRAKQIIQEFEQMESNIRKRRDARIVKVGCSTGSFLGHALLPACTERFQKKYPEVKTYVCVDTPERIEEKLLYGEIDFAILGGITPGNDLVTKGHFSPESFVLVAAPSFGFQNMQQVTVKDIAALPLVLREPESEIRTRLDELFLAAGYNVEPYWESSAGMVMLNAALEGQGLCMLPRALVEQYLRDGSLVELVLEGMCMDVSDWIVTLKDKTLTEDAERFIECWISTPPDEATQRVL